MDDAGWNECSITGGQKLGLVGDLHHSAAFQDDVEFVLAFMGVRSVLLPGLKRFQARQEKTALNDGALPHLVRDELCQTHHPFYEHGPTIAQQPRRC